MGSSSQLSVLQSLNDNDDDENKLKSSSNGVVVIIGGTEGMGSSSPSVGKRSGLKKWRRIPRGLAVKKETRHNGGSVVSPNLGNFFSREDSENSQDQGSRSSSDPRLKYEIGSVNGDGDDQPRNERVGPGKKARGFRMESSATTANVGSDSGSTGFVFVQGATTHMVASKGGESGVFAKYDEEEYSDDVNYDDDKIVNEEAPIGFVKSDDDDGVSQEDNSGKDEDVLVESIKGLDSAQEEFAREVQKWKDVGKDEPSIFDDPILNMLECKDAKILELESTLTSADTEAEFEDHLKKRIQVEVEYIVISTKSETLTSELLREIRHNVQLKNALSQGMQPPKKQTVKSETREDVKTIQNRMCISTSFLMIQLILLLITLYLKFAPQSVEIVPT